MDLKKCGTCKIEFPKTEKYFFKRVIRQQNKKGISTYFSFKSNCKKCHNQQSERNRIKNRCKDLSCDISEYNKKWKEQYTNTRSIHNLSIGDTLSAFHSRNITDVYIKSLLRDSSVPKEIIETKRLIIQLKRELKTIKN
jgi:phage-related protein